MKFYLLQFEYMVMVMEKSVPGTRVHNLYNNHYSTYVFLTTCLHAWFLFITWMPKHDQLVREMSLLTGSAPTAPRRVSNAIHSEKPSLHPSETSLSLWGDWWWQRVPPCSLFLFVCKLCEGNARERESQSLLLRSPLPYLHIGGICFDLVNCPKLDPTSGKRQLPVSAHLHSACM